MCMSFDELAPRRQAEVYVDTLKWAERDRSGYWARRADQMRDYLVEVYAGMADDELAGEQNWLCRVSLPVGPVLALVNAEIARRAETRTEEDGAAAADETIANDVAGPARRITQMVREAVAV